MLVQMASKKEDLEKAIVWNIEGLVQIFELVTAEAHRRQIAMRQLAFLIEINPQTFSNLGYNRDRGLHPPSLGTLIKIAPFITNPVTNKKFTGAELIVMALNPAIGLAPKAVAPCPCEKKIVFTPSTNDQEQTSLSLLLQAKVSADYPLWLLKRELGIDQDDLDRLLDGTWYPPDDLLQNIANCLNTAAPSRFTVADLKWLDNITVTIPSK
jgi:hypothetical protein